MLIKQNAGSQIVIGGNINDITSLYLSVWNWKGISDEIELISLSDNFSYFFVRDLDKFLHARAVAFAENWQNYWQENDPIWQNSIDKAKKEYDDIPSEKFLPEYSNYFTSFNNNDLEHENERTVSLH